MTENLKLKHSLDLFRRLPPNQIANNLGMVYGLVDEDTGDELLNMVECPLETKDTKNGKFLCCDANRDGDFYRSPHDNEFYALEEDNDEEPEGTKLEGNLRKLEIEANKLFSKYTHQYYQSEGLCSCYIFENEDGSFSLNVLIQKHNTDGNGHIDKGIWDAIHVAIIKPNDDGTATYSLISTIILTLKLAEEEKNKTNFDLSGFVQEASEQITKKFKTPKDHLVNVGNLLQDQENMMYNRLKTVYFGKAGQVTNQLRNANAHKPKQNFMNELNSSILARNQR